METATWSSEPRVLVMSIAMGVGAFILSLVVYRWWSHKTLPKDMRDARDGLELATRRVVNSNIQLMEAIRDLADMCRDMPPEYIVVAHQAMRLAQLMEEAAFEEGAREGVFPRPMFTAGNYSPPPTHSVMPPSSQSPAELPNNVVPLPPAAGGPHEMINGQLMRTG